MNKEKPKAEEVITVIVFWVIIIFIALFGFNRVGAWVKTAAKDVNHWADNYEGICPEKKEKESVRDKNWMDPHYDKNWMDPHYEDEEFRKYEEEEYKKE